MNGMEWLQYMQQGQQPEGPSDLERAMAMLKGPAMAAGGAALGGLPFLNIGFANGGVVPNPDMLMRLLEASRGSGSVAPTVAPQSPADPFAGMSPEDVVGPPPEQPQYAQARHPGWESAAQVLSAVLSKLPPPRAGVLGQNQTNKTIGAYMPAASALAGAIPAVAQGRREAVNAPLREEYLNKRKEYDRGLTDVRVAMLKRKGGLDGSGAELTDAQYEALGVPKEYRSKAGYDAWLKATQRSDSNLNRLQIRAAATKDIAQFPEVRDAYGKVQSSAKSGTGVSDMALVFSFMRVLDPTSVVREGEYERAIKTEGIPGWLWAMVQRVQNGALLTKDQRERMVKEAGTYFEQKRSAYRRARQWVDRIADHYGINRDLALPNLESPDVYIGVSPNEPDGGMGDGVDEYGVPLPKLKGAGR